MKKINFVAIIMMIILSGVTAFAGNPELPIGLGSAENFAILAKSGISTVPGSQVTGDMGVSPIDSTAITGFSIILDGSGTFSTSAQVTGKIYAADYATPTPVVMIAAIGDMEIAYNDAKGRTSPDFTELGTGSIGGLTLTNGLYKWGTTVLVNSDVTIDGGPDDVWIFQIAGNLTVARDQSVILSGGAQAKNIFWQVEGDVDMGVAAHFEGVILSKAGINMETSASINGRLLAQTAVTVQSNIVTAPIGSTETTILRSSDVVSGPYTNTPVQYISHATKSITAPQQGSNQYYLIRSDPAVTLTGITTADGSVVITYQ